MILLWIWCYLDVEIMTRPNNYWVQSMSMPTLATITFSFTAPHPYVLPWNIWIGMLNKHIKPQFAFWKSIHTLALNWIRFWQKMQRSWVQFPIFKLQWKTRPFNFFFNKNYNNTKHYMLAILNIWLSEHT